MYIYIYIYNAYIYNAYIYNAYIYIMHIHTYITLHYITLHYIILYYIILYYITLHYITTFIHSFIHSSIHSFIHTYIRICTYMCVTCCTCSPAPTWKFGWIGDASMDAATHFTKRRPSTKRISPSCLRGYRLLQQQNNMRVEIAWTCCFRKNYIYNL